MSLYEITGKVCTSGGGLCATNAGLPAAPTQLTAYALAEGGAYVVFAAPSSNGGSALTSYIATSSPGGLTGTTTATTTPAAGLSARCDINGLTPGQGYTFTVQAVNANGTGPASSASNSVTAATPGAPYIVACGGSQTGINPAWSDDVSFNGAAFYVTPGTSSQQGPGTYTAPTNPNAADKVVEWHITGANGGYQPRCLQINTPVGNQNGRFNLTPYTNLVLQVFPKIANQGLAIYFEICFWWNGVATTGTNDKQNLTDSTQNWPTNQWSTAGCSLRDDTAPKAPNAITSNTATVLTFTNGNATVISVGDYYEIDKGDQSLGQVLNIGRGSGNAGWGPTSMTQNSWNSYTIPLSAFNSTTNVTGSYILKFALADSSGGLSENTVYFSNIGFS